MYYTSLKISGFEDILPRSFRLTKKVYDHSVCDFSFIADRNDFAGYYDSTGSSISISNGEEYIFYGTIDSISVNTTLSNAIVTVRAVSASYKSDAEPQKRIFQNPEKTFDSVIAYVSDQSGYDISTSCQEKLPEPLIQNDETDFAFLSRLSRALGLHLFVSDTVSADKVCISVNKADEGSREKIEEFPCALSFRKTVSSGQKALHTMVITLKDSYYDLSQLVSYKDFSGWISEVRIYMKDYIIFYEYTAVSSDSEIAYPVPELPERIVLSGAVAENDSSEASPTGLIKVRFECDYTDAEPDKMMWIPYKTPYAASKGGIVFMPDKDDKVLVIYSRGSFTAEEVFSGEPVPEEMKDFKNKYIANIFNKRITLAEEQLEIRADENTIVLTKDDITLTDDQASVVITNDSVTLKVGDSYITLKDKSIEFNTGDTVLAIDKDTQLKTGQFKIESSGETTVKSDKDFSFKASNIKGQADSNVSFKAGSTATIEGSKINLK